jgi:hypothetical protein
MDEQNTNNQTTEQLWSLLGDWVTSPTSCYNRDRISSSNSTNSTTSTTSTTSTSTNGSNSTFGSSQDDEDDDDDACCGGGSSNEDVGEGKEYVVASNGHLQCAFIKDGQVCARLFPNMKSFKSHMGSHRDKSYYCNELKPDNKVCRAKFNTARKLQRHIEGVHLNVRPFECQKCNKSFACTCTSTLYIYRHNAK